MGGREQGAVAVSEAADYFNEPNEHAALDDPIRTTLRDMILARDHATPRHLQRELGPSEVAHPCMKKMAYGIAEVPPTNPPYDPLASIIGTATHTWLESAAVHANMVLGRTRWLTETRVEVAPGLSGSCDLYDTDTDTVIDWKVPGTLRFTKYKKDPGPVYKTQVQMYGLGFAKMGFTPQTVAIAFVPRGKTLRSMHVWSAPYDEAVAQQAVARRQAVIEMMDEFDVENNPERYEWFATEPYDCQFCPWWSPRPSTALQCKGDQ